MHSEKEKRVRVSISIPGYTAKGIKKVCPWKTCTQMFTAFWLSFLIAKKWKQPECPSTDNR